MKESEIIDKATLLLAKYNNFVVIEIRDKFPCNELRSLRRELEKVGCYTFKGRNVSQLEDQILMIKVLCEKSNCGFAKKTRVITIHKGERIIWCS